MNGAEVEVGDISTEFLNTVEMAVRAGATTFALEVTSKALMGGWGQKWPAHIAVFTNISRDHMDMHSSPEAYLAAKAQLFISAAPGAHCVLNACDPHTALIAETIPDHARVHYYAAREDEGQPDSLLSASGVACSREGTLVSLADSALAQALGMTLRLAIVGQVHVHNALAAALATHLAGYSPEAIVRGLANFRGVPGRFEIVSTEPLVVVDYAHTPEGLRGTLETARQLLEGTGQLHLVFGCGGERDQGKRPEMGRIAEEGADTVTLTNDNPRRENPEVIAEHIMSGCPEVAKRWTLCLDRSLAIGNVIHAARPKDIVIITGKGHETFQEIAGEKHPMSDVALVKVALAAAQDGEGLG